MSQSRRPKPKNKLWGSKFPKIHAFGTTRILAGLARNFGKLPGSPGFFFGMAHVKGALTQLRAGAHAIPCAGPSEVGTGLASSSQPEERRVRIGRATDWHGLNA